MTVFKNDEKAFQEWVRSNHSGYILNCETRTGLAWKLHRAGCNTLRTPFTGEHYFKVCSSKRQDLMDWAKGRAYPEFGPCQTCNP